MEEASRSTQNLFSVADGTTQNPAKHVASFVIAGLGSVVDGESQRPNVIRNNLMDAASECKGRMVKDEPRTL